MQQKHFVDVSIWTVIKIVLVFLGLFFLWFIRDIILLLLITWVLVTILHPTVEKLNRSGVPRILGTTLVYLLLFAILSAIISLIAPSLIQQTEQLLTRWPYYIDNFGSLYDTFRDYATNMGLSTQTTSEILTPLTGSVYGFTLNFISGFVSVIIVLVISFYVLIEEDAIKSFWVSLFPTDKKHQVIEILNKITKSWGAWIRGRLILSLIIGVLTYVGLLILGVPYALTLAFIVALMDFIPYIGPILAIIPIVVLAFVSNGWLIALLAVTYVFLIEQLEAIIFAPKIMQKTVGISPVTVIVSVLIGAKIFGIIGIILAIPIAAVLVIIFDEWRKAKLPPK
ncbi:AI-2E family transporter [Patescibacteria group bacterium]